jgi:hypothetical protein
VKKNRAKGVTLARRAVRRFGETGYDRDQSKSKASIASRLEL